MDIEYIVLGAFGFIGTLIGILYKATRANINKNTSDIERIDRNTDNRLDSVEKDIVKINTKIEK